MQGIKKPGLLCRVFEDCCSGLEPHAAHSTHAAATAGHRRRRLLRQLGNHGFRGHQQAGDGGGVLQRSTHHLGRIDDALDAVKERFADPVADRIMEALRVAKDVGGQDVGIVLRALATHVRREQRTRGELEARQSWTVNGARLAAASPWLILALLCMRPENARAFDSAAGAGVLAAGAVLTFIAHRIMRWIGRLPTESRSLA